MATHELMVITDVWRSQQKSGKHLNRTSSTNKKVPQILPGSHERTKQEETSHI